MKPKVRNFYTILAVKENAEYSQIRKRFRVLALKYHPDKNPQGHLIMVDLNKIKDVLLGKERETYDSWLKWRRENPKFSITPEPYQVKIYVEE